MYFCEQFYKASDKTTFGGIIRIFTLNSMRRVRCTARQKSVDENGHRKREKISKTSLHTSYRIDQIRRGTAHRTTRRTYNVPPRCCSRGYCSEGTGFLRIINYKIPLSYVQYKRCINTTHTHTHTHIYDFTILLMKTNAYTDFQGQK